MILRPLSDISLRSFFACHPRHNDIYEASTEALSVVLRSEVWHALLISVISCTGDVPNANLQVLV